MILFLFKLSLYLVILTIKWIIIFKIDPKNKMKKFSKPKNLWMITIWSEDREIDSQSNCLVDINEWEDRTVRGWHWKTKQSSLKNENAWNTMTLKRMIMKRALGEDARRKDITKKDGKMRVIGNKYIWSSESSPFAVEYVYMSIKYSAIILKQIISNHSSIFEPHEILRTFRTPFNFLTWWAASPSTPKHFL